MRPRALASALAGGILVAGGLAAAGAGALWPNLDRVVPRPDRAPPPARDVPPAGPAPFPEDPEAAPEGREAAGGRGWAHTLLACLAWTWLAGRAVELALEALGVRPRGEGPVLGLLFGAGYLLHLGLDARTPGGVPFWAGLRPLLRVGWFGVRLALWPLWFVAPGLNPFARPEVVEVRIESPNLDGAAEDGEAQETPPPPAERLPEAVRCPRCGAGHHPAAAFCQVCGAALRRPPRTLERPTR